jgi:phage terminase large subunit
MAAPDFVLDKLDDMCDRLKNGRDVVDHEQTINPAWRLDPFKWARERLKLPLKKWSSYAPAAYYGHTWDGTEEPLFTTAKNVAAGNNVAVFSGTGTGKTFLGAVITLWWLDVYEGAQVITVAPKKEQLNRHIWKEISRLWPLFEKLHPKAEFLGGSLEIRMRPERKDWFATGFVCGVAADEAVANKARGFHAERMLFLLEETTGIHPSILMAIKLTCTGPHNLRLFFGNPDSVFDGLSKAAEEPGVIRVRASALDHPNIVAKDPYIIPGAQSLKVLSEWREEWGEESPLYQSRVRGIPPAQDRHALIRIEWIKKAVEKWKNPNAELTEGPGALGVDVANSENGDKAAIAYGRGRMLCEVKSYKCPDANEYARHHVWPYIDSGMVEQERVGVDIVGVGVGCFNELKRLGAYVQALNGGKAVERKTHDPEPVKNLRSKMYWQMRTDFQKELIAIPDDPELIEDLLAPTWETQNGVIIVESKEDFKKRLPQQRSPDKGDAAVYWNWVRQARAGLDFGGEGAAGDFRGPVAF